MTIHGAILASAFVGLLGLACNTSHAADKPNIVYILVDYILVDNWG